MVGRAEYLAPPTPNTSVRPGVGGFGTESRAILQALKNYGMIVADNGSNWYVSGTPDSRWSDTQLNTLKNVPGSAFDVVTLGPVTTG